MYLPVHFDGLSHARVKKHSHQLNYCLVITVKIQWIWLSVFCFLFEIRVLGTYWLLLRIAVNYKYALCFHICEVTWAIMVMSIVKKGCSGSHGSTIDDRELELLYFSKVFLLRLLFVSHSEFLLGYLYMGFLLQFLAGALQQECQLRDYRYLRMNCWKKQPILWTSPSLLLKGLHSFLKLFQVLDNVS